MHPTPNKSTVEQIRRRFDNDVERFSNLETGQSAVIDSPLCMDLVASAAAAITPHAHDLLDIGCGAGNYTLKLIEKLSTQSQQTSSPSTPSARAEPTLPTLNCTLIDLSRPMLDRAVERITPTTAGLVTPLQGDMRELDLGASTFDIVVSSAALHHLRTDAEWHSIFANIHAALRPGGSFWIFDMIQHVHPAIESMMHNRYGDYLIALKGGGESGAAGRAYRDHVFAYIAQEDTPKPLMYQLDLLRHVGFQDVDILHKNAMGAAFGGRKS